jgi:hypothetical protein
MKRIHLHVSVPDLARSIDFYATAELGELSGRLKRAGAQTFDEAGTTCCYAQSDKSWVRDPAGVRWETFFTFGEATTYGTDPGHEAVFATPAACCGAAPKAQTTACC